MPHFILCNHDIRPRIPYIELIPSSLCLSPVCTDSLCVFPSVIFYLPSTKIFRGTGQPFSIHLRYGSYFQNRTAFYYIDPATPPLHMLANLKNPEAAFHCTLKSTSGSHLPLLSTNSDITNHDERHKHDYLY